MAYNSSKGPQTHGDVKFEGDAEDTQIDFETDLVALKTNGLQRFIVSGSAITASVVLSSSAPISASAFFAGGVALGAPAVTLYSNSGNNRILTSVDSTTINGESALTFDGSRLSATGQISASLGVTGSSLRTATTVIDATHVSSSLNVSGAAFYANGVLLTGGGGAVANYTNSGDNRIITSVNSDTINGESRLTFNGSTNFLFLSGNAQITNHVPTIFFSNSAGTGLGHFGYNNSDNILVQNNVTNKHIVFKANDNGTIREGFRIDGAVPEVVVNQGSDSLVDFRVESNDNTHMIFSDGSANRVGINSSAPTHTLSVSGSTSLSGSTFVTGSLTGLGPIRGQQLYYTHHHFAGANNNSWFPFTGNIESTNANEVHAMVVPHDGRLVKILFRVETKQNTSFTLKLYKGVDGVKEMDTAGSVEVEAITATLPNTDATTVTFATSGALHYNAGDIVGIQMGTFTANTGDVQATCVWEYDQLIP
tara:strand:- start:2468 stop:3907 length:1440 start_codon:yes stop_codon:yes gene_type:complete